MLTQRQRTFAVAGMLTATIVTGGALVEVLASRPAPPPARQVRVVPLAPSAPAATFQPPQDDGGDT